MLRPAKPFDGVPSPLHPARAGGPSIRAYPSTPKTSRDISRLAKVWGTRVKAPDWSPSENTAFIAKFQKAVDNAVAEKDIALFNEQEMRKAKSGYGKRPTQDRRHLKVSGKVVDAQLAALLLKEQQERDANKAALQKAREEKKKEKMELKAPDTQAQGKGKRVQLAETPEVIEHSGGESSGEGGGWESADEVEEEGAISSSLGNLFASSPHIRPSEVITRSGRVSRRAKRL